MSGWIKIHRKILNNPVVMKDPDHFTVWMYLLLTASHQEYKTLFGGKLITLKPGQLIAGRKKISRATKVDESKVKRILKLFEADQQIDQQTKRYGSVISILAWNEYQNFDQQNDQPVTNDCPTNDQQNDQQNDQPPNRENDFISTVLGTGVQKSDQQNDQQQKDGGAQKVTTIQEDKNNKNIGGAPRAGSKKRGRLDWLDEI